ncbi:SusC/RagA family TonB-linked outer membrane protein [Pedobacter alpinus]|uniref:SusC/RagA family TonB-linked outer membrane protein n=1 Tax=Pedobacter alpinus TaxID=1590643 RepID=A0ABW5TRZ0_9SPHI
MKRKLLQRTCSFLSFYKVINTKHTLLCASALIISSNVNAASEKVVSTTKFNNIEAATSLKSGSNKISSVKDVVIKGKITSEGGGALQGVTVTVKGSKTSAGTNTNGDYQITAPEGATLVFTYVGYVSQEINITGKTTVNVTMAMDFDKYKIDEVVVVGYGTQKKRDVTGAVGSVTMKDVENLPITRADQILQGRVSGVQVTQTNSEPGGNVSIRIRGTNSITAGNEPLFVIDGFPGAGDLNSINPNDIESIDVLKDASATAIYGSRGANGVVIVTTKKGKAGQTAINFETFRGIQTVSKTYDMMNATEFGNYLNDVVTLTNAETGSTRAPAYTAAQLAALGEGTDWQDALLRTAPISSYQLSMSGGSTSAQHSLSLNFLTQDGVVLNSGFKRGTVRYSLDKKISDKIKTGFNTQISRTDEDRALVNTPGGSAGGVILDALRFNPAIPVRDAVTGLYTIQNGPAPYADNNMGNPVAYAETVDNKFANLRSLMNIFGEYEFMKGLKLRVNGGVDLNYETRDYYLPSDLFFPTGPQGGTATRTARNRYSWINENFLTYDKSFNKDHVLNLLAGLSVQQFDNTNFSATNANFFTNILGADNIGLGSAVQVPSSSRSRRSLASYFGRANYSLMEKYLFTFTMRADGSSAFGDNNKWGYFPSAAVAWRVIDEDFMKSLTFLSDLKLRTSYGITGNQEIEPYSSLGRYSNNGYTTGATRLIGIAPNNISNPDLSWESTASLDLGIDAGFLQNRILFTVDYYQKKTSDLLLQVSIPRSTGYSTTLINAGGVENKGIELGLSTVNFDNKNFQWNTNANISFNKNKVTNLNGEYQRFVGDLSTSIFPGANPGSSVLRVGEPIGSFYGYTFQGIWQTPAEITASGITNAVRPGDPRYADLNDDKVINAADRSIIGKAQPDFIYGLTNNFSYKGLNLNIFLQGVQGVEVLNLNRYEIESGLINTNKLQSVTNRWTGPGTSNTIPKANSVLRRSTGVTSDVVEDGSFLRIKTVSLAYKIPVLKSMAKTVKSSSIYVTAQNLYTFTNYSGFDPEVNSFGGSNLSLNTDYNAYPNVRTFMVGLKVGF